MYNRLGIKMYTNEDVKTFSRLLAESEQTGFDNYNRNIARLDLQKFLSHFTEQEQDEMAKKIGASRKG